MNKYHYVYRITNLKENKHYYGCRTTKIKPVNDLGFKYLSSSTDKEFKTKQKERPWQFKYKIIKIYETREQAINFEIKLHNYFDVGKNPNFYNRAKQTSTGWDTTGSKFPTIGLSNKKRIVGKEAREKISKTHKGKQVSEETKLKMSKSFTGRKYSEEHNKKLSISKQNPSKETRENLSLGAKNRKYSDEGRKKRSISSSGGKNNNAQPCIIDNVEYSCLKEASEKLDISVYRIKKMRDLRG